MEIRGFKTLRQANLSFGKVNLFIGGNGSGKSNVLEAIGLMSASFKDLSELELQRRGIRLSRPTLFKSAFKNSKLRSTLDLSGKFDGSVEYKVSIKAGESFKSLRFFSESIVQNGKWFMGRSPNGINVLGQGISKTDVDPTRGLWDRFRETVKVPPELNTELNQMISYAIFAPQTAFLRGTDFESLPITPVGLHGGGLAQAAAEIRTLARHDPHRREKINEILDIIRAPGWTERFVVSRYNPTSTSQLVKTGDASLYFVDKFMNSTRNVLSAYDSSEGTLYLLFLSILLIHPESPRIFALDNVDNALNPLMTTRLIEKILEATCGGDYKSLDLGPRQVFLTSHNPTSLDAFDLFNPDQKIFVVSRDPAAGDTRIRPLEPSPGMTRADWIKAANGKSLSELWIEGKIRGALGL